MAADISNNSNNLILSLSKDEGIRCGSGQAVAMLPYRRE